MLKTPHNVGMHPNARFTRHLTGWKPVPVVVPTIWQRIWRWLLEPV